MNPQMIIVLCILAFMVVMLLTHKLPYGVTGMICCVLFVLTGVADLSTAFSGLSSSTTNYRDIKIAKVSYHWHHRIIRCVEQPSVSGKHNLAFDARDNQMFDLSPLTAAMSIEILFDVKL